MIKRAFLIASLGSLLVASPASARDESAASPSKKKQPNEAQSAKADHSRRRADVKAEATGGGSSKKGEMPPAGEASPSSAVADPCLKQPALPQCEKTKPKP